MYIYGFSYAWDNSNESILALLMPHYHYSNFIITYFRQHPDLRLFFSQKPLKQTYFSSHPLTSIFLLFLVYLLVYILMEKIFDELDGRISKWSGKMFRKITRCCRKKNVLNESSNSNKIKIDPIKKEESALRKKLHWNSSTSFDSENVDNQLAFKSQSKDFLVLRNICKFFGNFKALNNVNIALKKGEITCLLGHNGAGKSTLINILTGFLHPSEGEILWNDEVMFGGKSQGINELRQVGIGICTSKDILYESMTVYEHLKLASLVKGIPNATLEITEMMKMLNLSEYVDKKVGKLSGGCKRKLSIGIALIGDPKIVFLDEPTSALDPVSRREILDLLAKLKIKNDKIILLTTHHLEEAELLSDFVVVLSRGRTVESGSLLQLKKKFNVGNQIKLSRKQENSTKKHLNFKNEVKRIKEKVSPETRAVLKKLEMEQLDALSISIKSGSLDPRILKALVTDLETVLGEKYYISVNSCTFDDIFREIDKIYEQGAGGGNQKKIESVFREYATFIKGKPFAP
jgi:ABC-type multidrug transport system ATPase subunit